MAFDGLCECVGCVLVRRTLTAIGTRHKSSDPRNIFHVLSLSHHRSQVPPHVPLTLSPLSLSLCLPSVQLSVTQKRSHDCELHHTTHTCAVKRQRMGEEMAKEIGSTMSTRGQQRYPPRAGLADLLAERGMLLVDCVVCPVKRGHFTKRLKEKILRILIQFIFFLYKTYESLSFKRDFAQTRAGIGLSSKQTHSPRTFLISLLLSFSDHTLSPPGHTLSLAFS